MPMRRVSGTCKNCDGSFERMTSSKDRVLFCGKSCAASWNNRHRSSSSASQRPCETCPRCGGRRSDSRRDSFCRSCRKAVRLEELQALTIGELRDRYGTHDFHAKLRGLSRSAYDGPMSCRECGYDLHVDICHLRPVASFPLSASVAEVNDLENLAALCPNHHWELDAGLLGNAESSSLVAHQVHSLA